MGCKFRPGDRSEVDTADIGQSKYMTTVRMGPRGQIVIPKEARELFDLHPGESMLLLADRERGIALIPKEWYQELFTHLSRLFPTDPPAPPAS